jgi:hypothetical protein
VCVPVLFVLVDRLLGRDEPSEDLGGLLVGFGDEVGVDVQRRRRVAVAETP